LESGLAHDNTLLLVCEMIKKLNSLGQNFVRSINNISDTKTMKYWTFVAFHKYKSIFSGKLWNQTYRNNMTDRFLTVSAYTVFS